MNRRRIFRWIMIVFNAVVIALAVHFAVNYRAVQFFAITQRKVLFRKNLGWRAHKQDTLNQLGFRGQKIKYNDNDFVVVLLGDSQVEAYNHPLAELPETYLQNALEKGFRVFSVGAGGYGNDQELIALQEYYKNGFRADLVLLWFTPQNDIWNNIFPTHEETTPYKPTYIVKNGKLEGPKYYTDIESFEKLLPPSGGLFDFDANKKYDGYINNHPVFLNTCFDNFISGKSHTMVYADCDSPRMQYGTKLTNLLIEEISKTAQKNGSKFISFYNDFPDSWQYFFPVYCAEGEYLIRPLNKSVKFNRATFDKNVSACTNGIAVEKIMVNSKNPYDSDRDRHLNNVGNNEVMQKLAKILAEKNLLRR